VAVDGIRAARLSPRSASGIGFQELDVRGMDVKGEAMAQLLLHIRRMDPLPKIGPDL
jgi:hypothetical protein